MTDYQYVNIPQSIASSDINIPNPKDIVTSALPSIANLQDTILATVLDINTGQWNGSYDDLIQVLSMLVLMINQAVTAMQTGKQLAETDAANDTPNYF